MTEHAHDTDRAAGTEAWHRDLPGAGDTPPPTPGATGDGPQPLWRKPLFHVKAGTLDPNTAQTKGMKRFEALSARHGGTQKLWLGSGERKAALEGHAAAEQAAGHG